MYHYIQPAIPALTAWLAHAPTIIEPDHRDLYLKFLAGLGISEAEARDHLPLPSTIGAASAIGYFCRSSFEEGLGAFGLGVELQVPGRPNGAEVIVKALRHYAIPRDAMEFYFVHVEAEEEHGGNAEAALEPFTRTREQQALVRRAFQWTVLAHQGMQAGFDAFL